MKKVLLKLLLFILIISSLVTGIVILSDFMIKSRMRHLLPLCKEICYVFAGNSTIECAVDNRRIKHTVNIAQAGEAYMYTYGKLKALLSENEQIKTVFLSFSFADILMEKEESWLFSDYFIIEKVQYYNHLLEKPEKELLLCKNPRAYIKGVIKSAVRNSESVLLSYRRTDNAVSIPNFGGYKHLDRDKLDADPGLEMNGSTAQSPYQIKYLKLISELCHERSVLLILLNPPKHKSYTSSVNKEIKDNWTNVRESLAADSLLDLSEFTLHDSCYADLSHLNYRGARIFSDHLDSLLNPDSQLAK